MRKVLAWFATAGVVVLTGCNTMAGAGKDIQRGGEMEDAAHDVKQKM